MTEPRPRPETATASPAGAAAGAVAVLLFVAGAALVGDRPPLDAPAGELVAHLDEERHRLRVAVALFALTAPLLVWFLATVASLAAAVGPAARRAGAAAFGCGLVFVTLFLADITALAVAALRPATMAAAPELAVALRDLELLLMGTASFAVAGLLAAFAVLALRHAAVWPPWLGRLAVLAALAYPLRAGTLFTTEGPFAADGVLGLYVPVAALAGWLLAGSVVLVRTQLGSSGGVRRRAGGGGA